MIRALSVMGLIALMGCSGAALTNVMPGTPITVNGTAFTVQQSARAVTVRNFETGRTAPDVLITNAALAAQRVTGCPVASITKDAFANSFDVTVDCPA